MSKISVFLLLISMHFGAFLYAQKEHSIAYDSVYNLMVKGVSYDNSKLDSFLYWNDFAIELARGEFKAEMTELEFNSLSASYFNNLAVYMQKKGMMKKALAYMDSTLVYGRKSEDDTVVAIFYNNIGTMYLDDGDILNAEKNHNKALEIRLRLGDSSYIGNSYNNIGNMFQRQSMLDKAEEFYQKSYSYYESSDPILRAIPLINMANVYKERGDMKMYYEQAKRVYELAVQTNNERYISRSAGMIGQYFLEENKLDTAFVLLEKARVFFEREDNPKRLAIIYAHLATYYVKKKNFAKAHEFTAKSENSLGEMQVMVTRLEVYKILHSVFSALGENDQSLSYLANYYELKDSLASEQFVRRQLYKENQLKFKFEKDSIQQAHNSELAIADEKLKTEEQFRLFIVLGIIGFMLIGVVLFRNYRLKQKYIKENYEKEQLLNQHLSDELKAKTKKLVNSSLKNIKTQKAFSEIEKLIDEVGEIESDELESNVLRIKSEIRDSKFTEKKLENYEDRLISENEGFTAKLKQLYPELTPKELRLCVLLRMNYSSDEICDVLGVAATTLKSSRYRIHKKMNLEKGLRLQDHLITLV